MMSRRPGKSLKIGRPLKPPPKPERLPPKPRSGAEPDPEDQEEEHRVALTVSGG